MSIPTNPTEELVKKKRGKKAIDKTIKTDEKNNQLINNHEEKNHEEKIKKKTKKQIKEDSMNIDLDKEIKRTNILTQTHDNEIDDSNETQETLFDGNTDINDSNNTNEEITNITEENNEDALKINKYDCILLSIFQTRYLRTISDDIREGSEQEIRQTQQIFDSMIQYSNSEVKPIEDLLILHMQGGDIHKDYDVFA